MSRNPLLVVILLLSLVAMACRFSVNLPVTEIKTGPTQTDEIQVPLPEDLDADTEVALMIGAGELQVSPGAGQALITGSISYNVADFKPEISQHRNSVRIEQGPLNIQRFPSFSERIINNWDLGLASTPMRLRIEAGAYRGDYELGGLALSDVDISDGASEVTLRFSEPNLVEMGTFRYRTGASNVSLRGLANANFSHMSFQSGAGNYSLDFSGEIMRTATVRIESGISNIKIIMPEGSQAQVSIEGVLSNVDAQGGWKKSGSFYQLNGSGPTLNFVINLGAGNLELSTR